MRGNGWAIAFAAVLLGGCAHDLGPREGPVVEELTIDGAHAVDEGDIKDQLLTRETSWIPFSKKRRLDQNLWNQDLKRIERYYRARGFYQAEVLSSDVRPKGDGEVALHVAVREGNPTFVTSVDLRGLDTLTTEQRDELRRVLQLEKGDTFVEEKWTGLPERMEDVLISFGYAEAEVAADARVDLARRTAELQIDVMPGTRYRIGEVRIEQAGDSRVEEWRIREQALEALEPETWYSQDARQEVQERVYGMGVFGAAQVYPGKGDPATGTLPLNIQVAEAPYHEVAWGFGFGFEQLRQEGHVVGEYRHRDFLGELRELRLDARAGYAFIPNILTATRGGDAVIQSGPIARLTAELEQPRLFHPNLRLLARTEVERAVEQSYSFTGGRAHLGVPWRPRSWLTIEPSYNIEVYRLTAGATTLRGQAPELLFGCDETCVLSYLEQRIAFDRRDDPQEPKEGFYLALALQEGGGPLGGSFDYLRIRPEARVYKSFGALKRLTFAARVNVGTLIPLSGDELETPIVARYFSGGDQMRGFSTQRLSPMRLVEKDEPADEITAEPVPIGGNGLFEASFETRYAITQTITLAGFVDTGFVTTERVQFGRPSYFANNLLWAVGTGARYRTPVGPVRLDLAYRLPFGPPLPVYQPESQQLTYAPSAGCFGLGRTSDVRGGAPESVCSIHLSIGEAF